MINIKIDSRKVKPGDTFVAINGYNVDGHDYIPKAIENGATKIIVEKEVNFPVDTLLVKDTNKWLNDYIIDNYSDKLNNIKIIGITGTNGKTTTAYLTYQMLNLLNKKTAYIGTIGFYIPNEEIVELPNTTPNILDLYDHILTAIEKKCEYLVMEVSSHALDLGRVNGIKFEVGAFTNLTQDHLDYHKTMENYLKSKLLILKQLKGTLIVNDDDASANKWKTLYTNVKTLGKKDSYYKIDTYNDLIDGTDIQLKINNVVYKIKTNLKNEFNIYNYLTAVALINNLGFELDSIFDITKNVYPPKGRCELIPINNGIAVVDYAHTPDAVDKIISSFKKNKKGKIITVIGCGGDRDPKKRPIMGQIATENSDIVVFTSDNPRTEDPCIILENILSGVIKNNYIVEIDRISAIHKALDMMEKNDIVLVLGKGHEDYQIIGTEKIHLDDLEEIKKYKQKKN